MDLTEVVMGELTCLLGATANWFIVSINYDADFVHEPDLLFVIAF
jgi:hypothetical protein